MNNLKYEWRHQNKGEWNLASTAPEVFRVQLKLFERNEEIVRKICERVKYSQINQKMIIIYTFIHL